MNPDCTQQLNKIVEALNHHDWYTGPLIGFLGILIGWSMPFLLELWKGKRATNLLIDAAYREAALQLGELIGLLHTFKINAPANLHVNFSRFKTSKEHYDKAINEPTLYQSSELKLLPEVYRLLFMFQSLCEHKLAIGEEYAKLAQGTVFEIEDLLLKGGIDRKRFCKFLDDRIADRLLNDRSTEEFWRLLPP